MFLRNFSSCINAKKTKKISVFFEISGRIGSLNTESGNALINDLKLDHDSSRTTSRDSRSRLTMYDNCN